MRAHASWLFLSGAAYALRLYRAIRIVGYFVADEGAAVGSAVVGDGRVSVGSDYLQVEVDQALAGDVAAAGTHAVRGVAGRAGESGVDMRGVLIPAAVAQHLSGNIMALGAHGVGAVHAGIWIGIKIADALAGAGGFAELVAALQQMRPLGSVRAVGADAAEFAVVVGIVAVGAVNLRAHGASLRLAVQIEHVTEQAGLRQGAGARVQHGMTRGRRRRHLRNQIQRIAGGHFAPREISEDGLGLLARAQAVAAQAILILIHRRIQHRGAIGGADADRAILRRTDVRRQNRSERSYLLRGVRSVAVDAGGVAIIVQQRRLGGVVQACAGRKW